MARLWLLLSACAGFTGVALGAFAAHGLKSQLTPAYLAVFQTGAHYQLIHALALFGVGLLALLLLAATLKIMLSSSDPVQSAVNKALANDPRARDEQIEITRNTLREMGLDPGKNGDLGCLAAP